MRTKLVIIIILLSFITSIRLFATNSNLEEFFFFHHSGRYLEAFQLVEQSNLIGNIDTLSIEYASFLGCLGECEAELEYYDNAYNHLNKAIELCSTPQYKGTNIHINTLFQMAKLYSYMEEDSLCTEFAEQAWSLSNKAIQKQSNEYCANYFKYYNLTDEDNINSSIKEYVKTNGYDLLKAKALFMESLNIDSLFLSIHLLENSCNLYAKCCGSLNYSEYAFTLNTIGKKYSQIGQYAKAFKCFEISCKIYEQTHGLGTYNHLSTLIDMAQVKSQAGEYEYAILLLEKAKHYAKSKYGIESIQYAWILYAEAAIYIDTNNINKAIESQMSSNMIVRNHTQEKERLMNGLLGLSVMFEANNQYTEAQEIMCQYFDIISDEYDENSIEYVNGLLYLSNAITDQKQAISLLEKAINSLNNFEDDDCWKEKADAHETLARLYEQENLENALYHIDKTLDIYKDRLDFHHTDYLSALGLKAEYLYKLEQYDVSLELFSNYINLRKEDISSRFIGFDKKSRSDYWKMYLFPFNQMIPIETYKLQDRPESRTLLYNALLFKKGILLNAELVLDSSNSIGNKHFFNDTCDVSLDSLVISYSKSIEDDNYYIYNDNNYLKNLINVDYNNVRENLKNDEIAIEFAKIPFSSDSIMYCALIAKSNYNVPKLITLFKESELNEIERNTMFSTESLYRLIWLPIKEELETSSKVYFAPDGELYNIPVEHAYISQDRYLSDIYNIHRLSSTRELLNRNKRNHSINSAILFGGLNYDANKEDIIIANKNNNVLIDSFRFAERSATDGKHTIESLPYTKQEVLDIKSLFPSYINCKIFTDDDGTEDVFKSYSGDSISIIHFSTHGFYWINNNALTPVLQSKLFTNVKCEEDTAMTRTGLYLSGSNNIIKGIELPRNVEDGIITANEISELFFKDLNLVVLSACQTGLGDLKGDGVFGLQRGFKKAGAKALLMSMWKVDDFATKILMVEFYKNYLSGKTLQESLRNAQIHVRNYADENDTKLFESPYYWAGFILLDALD